MLKEIKQGVYVIIGSIVLLGLSFIVYFGLFRIFQAILNPEGRFGFVMFLRVGYGILLLVIAIFIDRMKLPEWVKASVLSAGLGTFLIALSVALYQSPMIMVALIAVTLGLTVFLLIKSKKSWFSFIPIILILIAIWVYQS